MSDPVYKFAYPSRLDQLTADIEHLQEVAWNFFRWSLFAHKRGSVG